MIWIQRGILGAVPEQQNSLLGIDVTAPMRQALLPHSLHRVTMVCRHPGAPAVIGLTRIYCNQAEEFLLVDVDTPEAAQVADRLKEEGWEIEAEIPV